MPKVFNIVCRSHLPLSVLIWVGKLWKSLPNSSPGRWRGSREVCKSTIRGPRDPRRRKGESVGVFAWVEAAYTVMHTIIMHVHWGTVALDSLNIFVTLISWRVLLAHVISLTPVHSSWSHLFSTRGNSASLSGCLGIPRSSPLRQVDTLNSSSLLTFSS